MVCARIPADPAHIKSRGSGGGDDHHNVIPLCRAHHSEQHMKGWLTFALMYPSVKSWLNEQGWIVNEYNGKMYHPKQKEDFDA